ncbi:LysR family transcriptional regulator [Clostridium saccharobutylicum]|uniref:HTH-type transcriptional regulator GltC n=1 Tax=Clostridium saccharobutylicum TaxID=169679 RepID=A0A1S8NHE1_CLOSA|nr:LysR family transcriptional regulator [Clostridium saccharobutylicum]OOM15762.1 HTH-type transcriptional regulator GltC [Clostridium saccharobutylicum]
MQLISYKIIITVYEQKSFQKASELLHMTPSAVSHAISKIEEELGFSLFIRNKNGVTLTSYGENLLPAFRNVVNSNESLNQAILEVNGLERGTVKIGCFNSVCTNWIPPLTRDFNSLYPNISIEIFQGTYIDIIEWIKLGIVDLGFLSVSSAGKLPIHPLYNDTLVCVVPKKFPVSHSDYISLDEIKNEAFVIQHTSCDADIQNYFSTHHLKIKSDYHVMDDLSTVSLVSHGFGICLMPKLVMQDISYPVKTYPIKPAASRIIGISALNPESMSPAVKKMYDFIINYNYPKYD